MEIKNKLYQPCAVENSNVTSGGCHELSEIIRSSLSYITLQPLCPLLIHSRKFFNPRVFRARICKIVLLYGSIPPRGFPTKYLTYGHTLCIHHTMKQVFQKLFVLVLGDMLVNDPQRFTNFILLGWECDSQMSDHFCNWFESPVGVFNSLS